MIRIENLVKRYGDHLAVDQLSFTVEPGKIYGFVGPNGAGKSTTMNVITGYIAASSGTVVIDGHDILKEPLAAKACIGYLPEIPPLYAGMTVQEYLMFVAELKRVPKKERAGHVEEIKQKTGLADVGERLIRNLSKGYQQRVGLAQALISDPKVLILDEPMVGLDPKQIIEMRDLIRGLSGKHTVILSSHILSEISAVCDQIMILSRGKLVADGTPEELEAMMQEKAEVAVTVLAEKEQAETVLVQMKEIEAFTVESGEETGSIVLHITAKDNADIRKELSVALASAGLPILSMNLSKKSLEDIFLELTGTEESDEEEFDEDESDDERSDDEMDIEEETDDDSNL
ncbi:ATP-binding cassette domain-containing protein [bacterium 0.1xD8-71]|nr:ATP-binding cassette domain-containing protein [bacterium 0.1xD8-71]